MEMDPDLVRSSRVNSAQDQCPLACLPNNFEFGVSWSSAVEYRHFFTTDRVAADRLDNFAPSFYKPPVTQSQVKFLNLTPGKLIA